MTNENKRTLILLFRLKIVQVVRASCISSQFLSTAELLNKVQLGPFFGSNAKIIASSTIFVGIIRHTAVFIKLPSTAETLI